MADNQKAKNAEEQQLAMPTNEEQDLADSQGEVQETEESLEAPAGESEEELSSGVKERTKEQFEKLKSQLREAKAKLFEQGSKVSKDEEIKPLYDPTTGLVDVNALTDLQKRAYEAEKRVREVEQRFQQKSQDDGVRELYAAHPELKNPKSKEAKELFDESERIWIHSQAYPEKYDGEQLSQKQAADLAKKRMGTSKQESQASEAKEQASFGAAGRPTQGVQSKVTSEEELKNLQFGTRIGDKDSMIARMRAIREASEAK